MSIVLLLLFFLLMLFLAIFSRNIFPSYFFFDNGTIRAYMEMPISINDKGYLNTALFLKSLGFKYNSPYIYEQLYGYFVYILLSLLLLIKYKMNLEKMYNLILFLFFSVLFSAYFTQYSKEIVFMSLLLIPLSVSTQKNYLIVWSSFFLIYAYFFRSYWFLTIILSFVIMYFMKKKYSRGKKALIIFVFSLFAVFFMILINWYINKTFLTDTRFDVNQTRIGSIYANSMIKNVVNNTSVFTDMINYLYCMANLFLPIGGIGSMNMIFYYLFFYVCLFKIYLELKKENFNKIDMYFVSVVISFFIVQGFFEPDLGSALRHQAILAPILLIL